MKINHTYTHINKNTKQYTKRKNKQKGFALIEVLVSIIIFMIALLGMMRLMTLTGNNVNESHLTSYANTLGSSMMDSLRANRALLMSGGVAESDLPESCKEVTDQMSALEEDMVRFLCLVQINLPSGSAKVTFDGGTRTAIVTIYWIDKRSSNKKTNTSVSVDDQDGAQSLTLQSVL